MHKKQNAWMQETMKQSERDDPVSEDDKLSNVKDSIID